MPATDKYGQSIPYSLLTDGADAQQLGKGIADGAAARVVMRFASAANRGATLLGDSAAQEGMVTYLTDADRLDYYDGTTWIALSPGPWLPLPLASGISARSGSPAYRVVNGSVQIRGTLQKSDSSTFENGSATTVTTLPVGYRPTGSRYHIQPTEWTANIHCRVEILPNGEVTVIIPVSDGSSPHWVGLDGIEYSTA
ncbi:hypothetical protein [Embleya sp. NPDC059237]|uniref:hypothetical protein n=1 Tax=Embleya sp. NPDC059237 TaxID=3346784 RepID=UPI0036CF7F25